MAGHFPQKHRKKMESDWHLGIWVGRTSNSQRAHSADPRRSTSVAGRLDGLNWRNATTRKSWRMRQAYPGIRDHPEIMQTEGPFERREPPRGTPGQSDEQLADRRPGAELAQFHASFGQTPGCQACLEIKRGFHHTVACKARQQEWQDRRESEETETSGQGPSEPKQESGTMPECHAHPSTETVGGDPVRRPRRWTNINELRSWTTTHLEWEANKRNCPCDHQKSMTSRTTPKKSR